MRNTMSRLVLFFCALLLPLGVWAQSVNINKADVEELSTLTNIGEVKARKIIEYRKQHGDFQSADDLLNVDGIGQVTLDKNRDRISVSGASAKKQRAEKKTKEKSTDGDQKTATKKATKKNDQKKRAKKSDGKSKSAKSKKSDSKKAASEK